MSRTTPEWIGASPDSPIPTRVKLRVFEACQGRCAVTGQKVRPGHFEYDHRLALILGGENRESNIQLLSTDAHKAKTAMDVSIKSKVARIRAKHLGLWKRGPKIQSRGFEKRKP